MGIAEMPESGGLLGHRLVGELLADEVQIVYSDGAIITSLTI